jgi:hypothetical protein
MPYKVLSRDAHFEPGGPKRVLALDGGGLRGIVTLGYLQRIEDLLRARVGGDPDFRLAHYFDLIAGTSTGAIIAAGLARGMTVAEITELYFKLGREVFYKSLWRQGILRARYSHKKLTTHLKAILGEDTTLGSDALRTGVLVVTKRMDTGSPWALGNNPRGSFHEAPADAEWTSNRDYPLWKVVRASTAAPSFFSPEQITITEALGERQVVGEFVDGGVSPFNNPTLQAFMYATIRGYGVNWETGADRLFIVSVGTGRGDPGKAPTWITAKGAVQSLLSLMDDVGSLVETVAQWLSTGHTHRDIDLELGDLSQDFLGGQPQFTYERYDLDLLPETAARLRFDVTEAQMRDLTVMDEPAHMKLMHALAVADAAQRIEERHFPAVFDLG